MSTDIIAAIIIAIATIISAAINNGKPPVPPGTGSHIPTPSHYPTNWTPFFSVILMVMGLVFIVSGMMPSGYNSHQFLLGIGCYLFGLLMVVLFR